MQTANNISSAKKSRGDARRHVRAGKMLLLQRRLPEAIDQLRKGLLADPDHREARLLLAKSLVADKRLIEAWAELEKLLNSEPDLGLSVLLVKVCLAVGDPNAALDFAERFMNVHGWAGGLRELADMAGNQVDLLADEDTTEREEERDTQRIHPEVQSGLVLLSGELVPIPSEDPEDAPTWRATPQQVIDELEERSTERTGPPEVMDELEEKSTERILPTYLTVEPEDLPTEQVPERSELIVALEELPTNRERTGASPETELALQDLAINRRLVRPEHLRERTMDGVPFEEIPITAGLESVVRQYSREQSDPAASKKAPHLRLVPPPVPKDARIEAGEKAEQKRTYAATAVIRPPSRPDNVIPLTHRKQSRVAPLPAPAAAPRPARRESARWLFLALVTVVTLALAAAVGFHGVKHKAAGQHVDRARELAAVYDVESLRSALLEIKAAADKGGRTAEVVALAAAVHGELNYEFGESGVTGVASLINEADKLGAGKDPVAAADLALARAYLVLARRPLAEARPMLHINMNMYPRRPVFKVLYGQAMAGDGEPAAALEQLADMDASPRVLLARAHIKSTLGHHIEALNLLQKANMEGLPEHHYKLEAVLLEVSSGASGPKTLEQLYGLLGDQRLTTRQRAWALLSKAELHQQKGQRTQAAVTLILLSKMRRPTADAAFRYRLARALMGHKDYSRAQEEIERACYISPQNRHTDLLQVVKTARGQFHADVSELALDVQANPNSDDVRKALSKILRRISTICDSLASPLPGCPKF